MDEKEEAQKIQEQAEREAKEKAAKENAAMDAPTVPTPAGEEGKKAEPKSPLEEARALDKSIKESTAKIQKLLERNEKLFADAALAGKGFAAPQAPRITPEEKASQDRVKAYGQSTGAKWAEEEGKKDVKQ